MEKFNFGNRLKELRKSVGITQAQLADALHERRATLSNYENKNVYPGFNMLIKLADYFHVSVDYLTGRTDDYEINCKLFDFPSFDLFYQTNNFYNCVIPFDVEELSKVEYLFDSIIEQLSVQPDNMWSCRARMSVIRIFDYAANLYKEAFEINQESDTLIDCILTFIEFNLEKQFTIDNLCRWYNTNRTTLMTEFKHITGKTINEFVIDKRISVSKKILEFTNISIEELSEKCGFSSQSYFTRTFKKKTGLSPTQYRKQAIEKRIEKFQT